LQIGDFRFQIGQRAEVMLKFEIVNRKSEIRNDYLTGHNR
jgi:hypothetical protein